MYVDRFSLFIFFLDYITKGFDGSEFWWDVVGLNVIPHLPISDRPPSRERDVYVGIATPDIAECRCVTYIDDF